MVVDLSSFVVNLHQRRDASFYLFGEASQFVYRLCSRCFTPDTVPLENSWFLLKGFKTAEGKFKEVEDFLIRLKLSSKVAAASKIKAEGLLVGKKPDKATIQKTVNEVETDFVQEALSFIKHVIEGVLHQVGLNSYWSKAWQLSILRSCLAVQLMLLCGILKCFILLSFYDLGSQALMNLLIAKNTLV